MAAPLSVDQAIVSRVQLALWVNAALFDPAAFQRPVLKGELTWHFRFRDDRLTAPAAEPSRLRFDFTFGQFGLTPPA